MNKLISIATAMAIGLAASAALAQDNAPSETVRVTAPLLIKKQQQKMDKMHVLSLSVEKVVSYADLDLSKEAGATAFRTRISDTAAELCKELDSKYPQSVYIPVTNQNCVKAATDGAMPLANEIIAAR